MAEPLLEKARAAWRDRLGARYLPLLQEQMAERRATAGDVAFLLEPDLKESHGGLRDVSVLRAISAFAPLLAEYADLASLEGATALLTDIRVELHRLAQREHDKLLLQDQDQVAAGARLRRCRRADAGRLDGGPPDRLGQRRRVAPTPAVGPHPGAEAPLPPLARPTRPPARVPADLGPDMVEVDGEIALTPLAPVSDDAVAALAPGRDRRPGWTALSPRRSLHRLADRMPSAGRPLGGRDARRLRRPARHSAGPPSTRSSRSTSTACSSA